MDGNLKMRKMKICLINKSIKSLCFLLTSSFVFFACENTMENVDKPDFDVRLERNTYKLGDTITFKFKGNPDIISFYSGVSGNDYEYAHKDRYERGTVELTFQSQVRSQSGPNNFCQEDQFHMYYSNNFEFTGSTKQDSINAVQSATWTEITNKFVICPLECSSNTSYKQAGQVNIADLFEEGTKLHIAYRYINKPYSIYGNGNIWRFSTFSMVSKTEAGDITLMAQNTANWQPVFIGGGWDATRFTNTGSVVTMRGPSTNEIEQELWAVSEGVDASLALEKINVGPDWAYPLKTISEVPMTEYSMVYDKPGTYTAVFVAKNSNIYGNKDVIKKIQITITQD